MAGFEGEGLFPELQRAPQPGVAYEHISIYELAAQRAADRVHALGQAALFTIDMNGRAVTAEGQL